jgi:dimethylamine/trimethylamine dehydrogenase
VTKVEFDTVVLVTSRVSHRDLFRELKDRKSEWAENDVKAVYETGDGQTPRFIQLSVFEAHRMAREFETENPQKPLDFIRERQIWGQDAYPKPGA